MGYNSSLITESKITRRIDDFDNRESIYSTGNDIDSTRGFMTGKESEYDKQNSIIQRYREYCQIGKVNRALRIIVDEAIVPEAENSVVVDVDKVMLVNEKQQEKLRTTIVDSFASVLNLIHWSNQGDVLFGTWWRDGILPVYFETKTGEGLVAARPLDILRLSHEKDSKIYKYYKNKKKEDTFFYNPFLNKDANDDYIEIPEKNIIFITSGVLKDGLTISFLHNSMRSINLMQMMENSAVVHTFIRAPQRYKFNINVAGMSKPKAEAYMKHLQTKLKSKFAIDTFTGEVRAPGGVLSMQENFWFADTGQGKHDVEAIGGDSNFDNMPIIQWFYNRFLDDMGIPLSRVQPDSTFNFGSRSEEIKRDELQFFKDIKFYRRRWNEFFRALLRIDLEAKGTIEKNQFETIKNQIRFVYENDNMYEQAHSISQVLGRIEMVESHGEALEKWYSKDFIRTTILNQTVEQQKQYKKERDKEQKEAEKEAAKNQPETPPNTNQDDENYVPKTANTKDDEPFPSDE